MYLGTRKDRLEQFFGGYFHQDWTEEHADEIEVIDRYARDHHDWHIDGVAIITLLKNDLKALLDAHRGWKSDDFWKELWDRYDPEFDGINVGVDAHKWLESLASRLEFHETSSQLDRHPG